MQKKNGKVDLKPLAEFSADYQHKRIVLCQSGKGFLTIDHFIEAKPSVGSKLSSIKDSAAGNAEEGFSSYDVADTVQRAGEVALEKLSGISSGGDPDLEVNIKHIHAQAYLSLYYAEKIRAPTALTLIKH